WVSRRARGVALLASFCFQAEDGIRDFHVTGVQTCALPILGIARAHGNALGNSRVRLHANDRRGTKDAVDHSEALIVGHLRLDLRSEERRVGKEGRSRGWTGQ